MNLTKTKSSGQSALMKKYGLAFWLCTFCSCGTRVVDEKRAAAVVQKALSLSGPVVAERLAGGYSGASLFVVTAGLKKYVIRFLGHKSKEERQQEITCLKIASEGGDGPHLYFADVEQAVVIMEYLPLRQISDEQRQSKELYIALAQVLQKIHRGSRFPRTINFFDEVQREAKVVKDIAERHPNAGIPLAKLEAIIATLRQVLTSQLTSVPCHNDMNPNNLIFLGNSFRAIDYEDAAQSDPYSDIAAVAVFFCFNPASERILLSTYLEHTPFVQEEAKLYLMKQIVRFNSARNFLGELERAKELDHFYATAQVPTLEAFLKEKTKLGMVDFNDPETKLTFAKIMINTLITNFESQEFRDAVKALE